MSKITVLKYLQFLKTGVKNVLCYLEQDQYIWMMLLHMRRFRYICARHEAAAVMMASADSKLSNKLGVVIATTGPGL